MTAAPAVSLPPESSFALAALRLSGLLVSASVVTYFEGTLSVATGLFRGRILGSVRTQEVFVELQIDGGVHVGCFSPGHVLSSDALAWSDLDAALQLVADLGAQFSFPGRHESRTHLGEATLLRPTPS